MIIVDTALERCEAEGRPVRVGIVGAGYMGRGIALHILQGCAGMRLSAVYNRDLEKAALAYTQAGAQRPPAVTSPAELDRRVAGGGCAITDDPFVLCDAAEIDVVVEATGEIEFGAGVVLRAIEAGKYVVLMNAELDATLGPILKVRADRQGVIITNTDGDEPGVAMNLVRFARTLGYEPVAAGNIKGMLDHYRTPDTQRPFAEKYNQKVRPIVSFADGTKLSMETTVLANAAGFGVAQRGMTGCRAEHVSELLQSLPLQSPTEKGIVDYCVGAAPHTGAWVIGYNEDPVRQQYMNYFKMGDGPFYMFYTPYHLPHVQIVTTIARAALFQDATTAPVGPPQTEVLTLAKRDLKKGETLDGIGYYMTYGECENAEVVRKENLLLMGLAGGCKLKHDVPKDKTLSYDDVELPAGRLLDVRAGAGAQRRPRRGDRRDSGRPERSARPLHPGAARRRAVAGPPGAGLACGRRRTRARQCELAVELHLTLEVAEQEDARVFPIFGIDWQINDDVRVSSTGPGTFEAFDSVGARVYADVTDEVEFMLGGRWKSREYRLSEDSSAASGGVFRDAAKLSHTFIVVGKDVVELGLDTITSKFWVFLHSQFRTVARCR